MSSLEYIFVGCAAVGGTIFVLKSALLLLGFGADGDADADVGEVDLEADVDVEGELDGGDMGDVDDGAIAGTEASFQLLSIQGIMAFVTMFGLVGLGCTRSGLNGGLAVVAGTAAGLLVMYLIAKVFQFFKGMQSSGTIDMKNAIGQEGSVYLTIPAEGTGKASVAIQGRKAIFNAVSEAKEDLPSGTAIRVTKVASGNVLVVEKV